MYDLEMEHLWRKTWLHACHISEIPNDGSYKLFEQVGLNVIVTRGPGDQVRAFHNICRHRGSRVVLEPTGTAKRFVRSEEHPSELQSLMRISYAVFCLKKKTQETP